MKRKKREYAKGLLEAFPLESRLAMESIGPHSIRYVKVLFALVAIERNGGDLQKAAVELEVSLTGLYSLVRAVGEPSLRQKKTPKPTRLSLSEPQLTPEQQKDYEETLARYGLTESEGPK